MTADPSQGGWLAALRELSDSASSDDDAEDTVQTISKAACTAAGADGSLVFLSSFGGQWLCESSYEVAAAPALLASTLGVTFGTPSPQFLGALTQGQALKAPNPGKAEFPDTGTPSPNSWSVVLGISGPVLYVPILMRGALEGCLVLWKDAASAQFPNSDLLPATVFTAQAALLLELVGSLEIRLSAEVQEERERVARDLHDLAIQDLFAAGMALQGLRRKSAEGISRLDLDQEIEQALEFLDRSVAQIRQIVYGLQGVDQPSGLVDRLRSEASMSRGHLGFAPTYTIEVDQSPAAAQEVERRVNEELADDVVAVVKEALTNVARHANASSVQVSVEIHGEGRSGEIVVSILDDGAGVDPGRMRHSGLSNMQRRASLRKGSFGVGAGPRGRGTSLVWRAPLQ